MDLIKLCAQYEKYAIYDETEAWGGAEGYFKKRAEEILSILESGVILKSNKLPLLESALMRAFKLGQSKKLGKTATHYNSDGSIDNTICTRGTPNQTCYCDKCNKEFLQASPPKYIEHRGHTIKVYYDDGSWIAEVANGSHYLTTTTANGIKVPPHGKSRDEAIKHAKQAIDKMCNPRDKIATSLNKAAGVAIRFRPGEVNGILTDAITMYGGKYHYSPQGSKVSFTGNQFHEFLNYIKRALEDPDLFDDSEKASVRDTLAHIIKQLPAA